MERNSLLGVCFLLFSLENGLRLFTVEEQKSKPFLFKEKGMISPPFETFEPRDGDADGTINRLIREEIGFPVSQIEIYAISSERFNLIPGRSNIFTSYGIGILNGNPNQDRNPMDDDIVFCGWKTIEELLSLKVRIETPTIIDHFSRNYLPEMLGKFSIVA